MKAFSGLIVAAGLLVSAPLVHACGGGHCGESFEELDANHDGKISKKEFDAFHNKRFKELDANHDGKITPEEMDAGGDEPMEPCEVSFDERFEESDINHDGVLSRDEAEIGMPVVFNHFDEFDANKDGKISKEELDASLKRMHERAHERQGLDRIAPGKK